jgi:Fic family protein
LVLIERGVLPQPLLYLSVFFERNRNQYYDSLMAASRTGDLVPWIRFFLRGVTEQANDAEERTVRLVELQSAVRRELLAERAPMSAVRTAEVLFSKPYISASSLAKDLDVTFPTAQSAIDLLIARGDLVETTGRKRNRFYFSQGIFDAVYGMSSDARSEQPNLFEIDPIGGSA